MSVSSELQEIQQTAIRMLARREHSRFELRQKLSQQGFAAEAIDAVLEKLSTENLQSDQRFVENYVRSRSNKHYGPLRIAAELRERGVSKDLIAEYLQEAKTNPAINIEQVRARKFGTEPPKTPLERA